MHLKNAFRNSYKNKINANKEPFLNFKGYTIYNIFWLSI